MRVVSPDGAEEGVGFRKQPDRYCAILFFVCRRRMTPFAILLDRLGTLVVGEVGEWRGILQIP